MPAHELFESVNRQLSDSHRRFIRPMSAMVIRFSGKSLSHVGQSVSEALDLLLARAPVGTLWHGVMPKGAKEVRYATPRPVTTTGLKPVKTALEQLEVMPSPGLVRGEVQLCVNDGPEGTSAPETFAVGLSLASTREGTIGAPGGFLSFAVPLAELESPAALISLGTQLVELLKAEVAWLGPALWLTPLSLYHTGELPTDAAVLINLFGEHPQLDAPDVHATRWPVNVRTLEPSDFFNGLLAPAWSMWVDAKLAKRVHSFPGVYEETRRFTRYQLSTSVPFSMTEKVYAEWREGWQALSALHLSAQGAVPTGKYLVERLNADSHALRLASWRSESESARLRAQKATEFRTRLRVLRAARSSEIVSVANEARSVLAPAELLWVLAPALAELVAHGDVDVAIAHVWLDVGEEAAAWRTRHELAVDGAALAVAAQAPERAIALLRSACVDHRGTSHRPSSALRRLLTKDARLKSLRRLPAYKAFIGTP